MTDARLSRTLNRVGGVALAVTAAVGVVCLLLTVLAVGTGVRPLVFRSGSMSPGTPAGALGFARKVQATDIHVGDVVTVRTKGGSRVTHRVVDLTRHGSESTLRLKGDANTTPDADLYAVHNAMRLWFSVPRAGYAVAWLSHAPGSYLLALYVALMLLLVGRRRDSDAGGGHRRARDAEDVDSSRPPRPVGGRRRKRGVVAATAVAGFLAGGIAILGGWGTSTWAAWTDTAAVSGTTLKTGTFVTTPPIAPVITGCSVANGLTEYGLTWRWTASDTAANTTFEIRYSNVTPANTHVTQTVTGISSPTNPHTSNTYPINDEAGDIVVVAITPSGTSANSNVIHYAGKNTSKTCTGTLP